MGMSKVHYASIAATGKYLTTKGGKCLPIEMAISVPYVVYQDELGNWLADFPSLGSMTQGDSEEHVRIAAEEGIAMLVRAMFSRGVVPSTLVGSMTVEARDTVAEKVARRKPGQLTIRQLITKLESCSADKPVYAAFDGSSVISPLYDVDSYRGYYEQLAIEPGSQEKLDEEGPTRCIDMAQTLLESLNKTFYGYKGGEFSMFDETPVWVSEHGIASGDMVVGVEEKADMVVIFTKKEQWP